MMNKMIFGIIFLVVTGLNAQTIPVFDSLQLNFSDTLYFDSGKWDLDSFALQTIQDYPDPSNNKDRIYLTGHTDAIGSLEYNEDLAQKRAKEAKAQFLEKSWREEMMVIQTFGERSPVTSNDTDEQRKFNRRVRVDLYRPVPYLRIKGKVFDPKTEVGIGNAQIKIHSRSISDSLTTDDEGNFVLELPVDSVVGLDLFAEGYFFKTHMMKVKLGNKSLLSIPLQLAEIGATADLSKLYFVGNQAVLLKHSEPELPKIKRFLQVNNHLRVEIAGHVNYPNQPPVTEDTFEWDLSVRRAQFLHEWLLENGIPEDQITYKGYGNHEMRFPRAQSRQEQELNRRVEIRILGERG